MKNAVVTGGASGIGLEFVKLLIDDNYKVFIVDNNKENLDGLHNIICSDKFQPIKLDLSKVTSPKIIHDKLKKENIDVLINNAGFGTFGKFYKTKWERDAEMINLHVLNTAHLTKLFLKDMIKRNDGKILNISSVAAFQPGPMMSLYYATKAFILHFTEAISNEVKDKNITISVLCPGQTKTNFQMKYKKYRGLKIYSRFGLNV